MYRQVQITDVLNHFLNCARIISYPTKYYKTKSWIVAIISASSASHNRYLTSPSSSPYYLEESKHKVVFGRLFQTNASCAVPSMLLVGRIISCDYFSYLFPMSFFRPLLHD